MHAPTVEPWRWSMAAPVCAPGLRMGHAEPGTWVSAQELELLEKELASAGQGGAADAFVTYLYGMVLSDRWVLLPRQGCRWCANHGQPLSCCIS